jgi:hypothetical protein
VAGARSPPRRTTALTVAVDVARSQLAFARLRRRGAS